MESTKDDLTTEIITSAKKSSSLCAICNLSKGEYVCEQCPIKKLFCNKCFDEIHKLPYNKNHQKTLINTNPNLYNSQTYLSNTNAQSYRYEPLIYTPSEKFGKTTQNFYPEEKKTNEIKNYSVYNPIIDVNISNKNDNYLEQMRKLYEIDQYKILSENQQLQKELNITNDNHKREINNLYQSLNDLKFKNENDIKILMNTHEFELKQILTEKDRQIDFLTNQNYELENANSELISKLNECNDIITKNKFHYNNKLSDYDSSIFLLEKENKSLKDFYENKMEFFLKQYDDEKNKLIYNYENRIENNNQEYQEAKNKYEELLKSKDEEISEMEKNHKEEVERLNGNISYLKEQIKKLEESNQELNIKNTELNSENNNINEKYNRAKRDIDFQIKENQRIKDKNQDIEKKYNETKAYSKYVDRLAGRMFHTSKSRGKSNGFKNKK